MVLAAGVDVGAGAAVAAVEFCTCNSVTYFVCYFFIFLYNYNVRHMAMVIAIHRDLSRPREMSIYSSSLAEAGARDIDKKSFVFMTEIAQNSITLFAASM